MKEPTNTQSETFYYRDDFENVVVRESIAEGTYRKFRGGVEEKTSTAKSKVVADAILQGDPITKDEYDAY